MEPKIKAVLDARVLYPASLRDLLEDYLLTLEDLGLSRTVARLREQIDLI